MAVWHEFIQDQFLRQAEERDRVFDAVDGKVVGRVHLEKAKDEVLKGFWAYEESLEGGPEGDWLLQPPLESLCSPFPAGSLGRSQAFEERSKDGRECVNGRYGASHSNTPLRRKRPAPGPLGE